jgi:peptidyl-prolyl cis-trans isomerase C
MAMFLKTFIAVVIFSSTVFAADASFEANTAALVNGAVITKESFRGELARILRLRKKTEQELDSPTLALTKKEALETLIGRELLYQESLREGFTVRGIDVDAEVEKLRKEFSSEEDFNTSLGKLDLSKEAIRSQIRRGMAIQALIDSKFSAKTAVTESQARNYYDNHQDLYIQPAQVRLSHILVKFGALVSNSGTTTARDMIEDIRRRLSQGEDFALLARESDDSRSNTIGGDLGYFMSGQLEKNMETAAFSLEVGQISSIVEDNFGYHILKVTERRPQSVFPFDTVKERISKQLQRERIFNEVAPYLKRLRKAAAVEIHLTDEN